MSAPPSRRKGQQQTPHLAVVTDTGELLTAGHVESEIMRLSKNMDEVTDELRLHAQAMADAEHTYKLEFAKAVTSARMTLDGDGPRGRVTVDQAESHAIVQCERQLHARLHADATLEVDKELLRTLRSQVDALRTIAANIRAQS